MKKTEHCVNGRIDFCYGIYGVTNGKEQGQ